MVETPKPEEFIDITGPEGETLFWHSKKWLILGRESDIQAHLDEMWAHYRDVKDDRLLALVAALCVENSLDVLLQAFAPAFDQYRDDTDFKASVKIKMARSLCLLPARILTACDLVRQIRNEFAHHLAYKELAQLDDDKFLRKLEPYVRAFNTADRDKTDYRQLFRDLVGFVLLALRVYTEQVRRIREYFQDPVGRQAFKQWAEETRKAPEGR